MKNKKKRGQFYTKNANYILDGLIEGMPEKAIFVDPFAGEKDLLKWLTRSSRRPNANVEAYDIEPKAKDIEYRDSFLNPISYKEKWVITNPPYLASNKDKDNKVYQLYNTNDLYKVAIKLIMGFDYKTEYYDVKVKEKYNNSSCEGGILIVPLNFFSDRDNKLRKKFFSIYEIIKLNIFEEKVFEDTDYTVCSFSFRKIQREEPRFRIRFYPSGKLWRTCLTPYNNYRFGDSFFNLIKRKSLVKVERVQPDEKISSNLCLRAIDTGTNEGRIKLFINDNFSKIKISDRTFALIKTSITLNEDEKSIVIEKFNSILEENREKYYSLFLTNFRNSTSSYARKRIEFKMAYKLIAYIISTYIIKDRKKNTTFDKVYL